MRASTSRTRVERIEPRAEGLRVHFAGEKAPAPRRLRPRARRRRPPAERRADRRGARRRAGRREGLHRRSTRRSAPTSRTSSRSATSRGPPLLAHRASHQGKVAAEVIAGLPAAFDAQRARRWPTPIRRSRGWGSPRSARKAEGVAFEKARAARGARADARSASTAREGLTKLLLRAGADACSARASSAPGAGELIAELDAGARARRRRRGRRAHGARAPDALGDASASRPRSRPAPSRTSRSVPKREAEALAQAVARQAAASICARSKRAHSASRGGLNSTPAPRPAAPADRPLGLARAHPAHVGDDLDLTGSAARSRARGGVPVRAVRPPRGTRRRC